MKRNVMVVAMSLVMAGHALSQADTSTVISRNEALNIYLDGSFCDPDYIRENLTIVNYVNDRALADVHIMLTRQETGSGGASYHMILIGLKKFASHADTVTFIVPGKATTQTVRCTILDYLQKGLLPFIMKTPLRDMIYLDVIADIPDLKVSDPWRSWMFEIAGTGTYNSQKVYKDLGLSSRLYTNKITDGIKFESSNKGEYMQNTYYFDMDEVLDSAEVYTTYNLSSWNLLVLSLGDHFSLGGFALVRKSTFYNLDLQLMTGPAVEYNVFSYKEASDRQFRFLYSLAYEHSDYFDTTIQGRLSDDLFSHQLDISLTYVKKWGSLSAFVSGSSYLDDFAKFSLGGGAQVDLSVFRGLFLDLSLAASYCQDQISIAEGTPDKEDVYNHQRELQTDFNYSFSIGIAYRFGSVFNNTVNPRFGN